MKMNKKVVGWVAWVIMIAFLTIPVLPAAAADNYSPGFPHTGGLGIQPNGTYTPWNKIVGDYFYLYGTQRTYRMQHTGTPTANRTITWPDATGGASVNSAYTKAMAGASGNITLTAAESQASYFTATAGAGATGAFAFVATACQTGKPVTVFNGDPSQNLTLKVSGQSGFAVAAGKIAMGVCTGTDFKAATADK